MTKKVYWILYAPIIATGILTAATYITVIKITQMFQNAEAGTHPK